ncbi:MAG: ABC transporter permease, partial [Candidatus Aerophobetes bacterium]|nr:ABC transporter permease [Candidatus Aerophobetes bacterium]
LALGMSLVIYLGHIDLSVGAAAAFTGVVAASFLKGGTPMLLTILLVAFIGMGIGLANGVIVTKVRIPFFITTLAMMSILTGAGFLITGGYPISLLPKSWHILGRFYLWVIPMPTIIMFCMYILFQIIQSRSRLGRYIYAVGGNETAARLCGINVDRIKIIAYILCGLLASIGGMILCSRLDSGDPSIGAPFLLSSIAAPILGGTKLSGGEGRIMGTLLGALILGIIDNGLSLMNVNIYYQYVVKGLIILAVVVPQIEHRVK